MPSSNFRSWKHQKRDSPNIYIEKMKKKKTYCNGLKELEVTRKETDQVRFKDLQRVEDQLTVANNPSSSMGMNMIR